MTIAVPAPTAPLHPSERPRVYLAGPAVFRPDAREHMARLAAVCARHGLRALLPTDDCGGAAEAPLAHRIYAANTRMLREADGVLADLQEWRGHEPDSGTAFEVGFAAALELPIVGYGASAEAYAERVSRTRPCARDAGGMLRECDGGMAVEDFGMPLNLMLGCAARLVPTAEDAIALLAAFLTERRAARAPHPVGSFDRWLRERVLDDAAPTPDAAHDVHRAAVAEAPPSPGIAPHPAA